ncbi:hypothetical protein [Nostocoides australiense]|nr:hypothetical protein [Tetrasphaera australiensis]
MTTSDIGRASADVVVRPAQGPRSGEPFVARSTRHLIIAHR